MVLSDKTWFGKALRLPFWFIPDSACWPILSGPLRGRRWIIQSSCRSCWLGVYEREKMDLLVKRLQPGSVFFDIGAQAGYFTVLASSLAGPAGHVVAFEPAPRNIDFLKQHVRLHNLGNVAILEAAVAGQSGVSYFDPGPSFVAGRLSEAGSIPVRTLGLDEEIQAGRLPVPHFLKIDVEGAELELLRGSEWLLARHGPQIALDIHSFLGPRFDHLDSGCRDLLASHGYRVKRLGAYDVYAWRSDLPE